MQRGFTAAWVEVQSDADVWRVVFADAEFNARRRLVLQRSRSPAPEDVEFGLDGYQVERDDPDASCQGGIETFELFPDRAVVGFAEDALLVPGEAQTLEVRFALRARQLEQVRGALAAIFAGEDCYIDAT